MQVWSLEQDRVGQRQRNAHVGRVELPTFDLSFFHSENTKQVPTPCSMSPVPSHLVVYLTVLLRCEGTMRHLLRDSAQHSHEAAVRGISVMHVNHTYLIQAFLVSSRLYSLSSKHFPLL